MVEVSLTVGKLDASLAVLLTKDHHLIEFPTVLLPDGVKGGSIVKIKCEHDLKSEIEKKRSFQAIQDEIFTMFGKNTPKPPVLGIKNVTQTSCVLQWDALDLGTASFKSLVLYRDGAKLFSVPNPLSNRTTKLSGLAIDKAFKFQLRLDTTAGVFLSEEIEVTTHKMTDLSGINVCVQDIAPNDQFTIDDINNALKNMGAHSPAHDKMKVDTTHYVTTRENKENPEFIKASEMNVPIIRPEWLKACERERRIAGVLNFYVKDCALPTFLAENYWADSSKKTAAPVEELTKEPAKDESQQPVPSVQITDMSEDEAVQCSTEPSVSPVEEKRHESSVDADKEGSVQNPVAKIKEVSPQSKESIGDTKDEVEEETTEKAEPKPSKLSVANVEEHLGSVARTEEPLEVVKPDLKDEPAPEKTDTTEPKEADSIEQQESQLTSESHQEVKKPAADLQATKKVSEEDTLEVVDLNI